MTRFNQNFHQSNRNYTKEMAEEKMLQAGYSEFQFTGCSYANGASFYFTTSCGKEVRVSDHPLTGKRAFNFIQISLVEVKHLPKNEKLIAKREAERAAFKARVEAMIAKKQAEKLAAL
jgi:hypothetical protein